MKTFALFTMLVVAQLGFAQKTALKWYTDVNEATAIAKKENKPMMLFFTGSDWCGWCVRLQKEVFNTPEFEAWAKENIILVELDFPRSKPQTEAIKTQNRTLQQQFAVRGYPTCWFVKPEKLSDGKMNLAPLGSKGYEAGGPANWITGASLMLEIKIKEKPNNQEWAGSGTGFFISKDGYIATNFHVIEDASFIQVEYVQKGQTYSFKADIVKTDVNNDLAILKINNPEFKSLELIPYVFKSSVGDVGSQVFTLGYPLSSVLGVEPKFTDGVISSKTGIKNDVVHYQISVPIQPGNSGGPLFDSKGNLIGITSSRLSKDLFDSENVNYAIKTSYLKSLIDVMPIKIALPNYTQIAEKSRTEQVKLLSEITTIIRVR